MPKQSQVLEIDPKSEIYFRGPYTQTVTEYFRLTNPTDKRIAFKVKTTAPKRYCVRPNNGVINPGQTVTIAVMLQASDGQITDKNKHKFMIQSVQAPEGTFNHEELFKAANPNDIMDSKFKCVFDEPNDEKSQGGSVGESSGDKIESETAKIGSSIRFGGATNQAKVSTIKESVTFSNASGGLNNDPMATINPDGDLSSDEMNGHENALSEQPYQSLGSYKDEGTKGDEHSAAPISQQSSFSTSSSYFPRANTGAYVRPTKQQEGASTTFGSTVSSASQLASSSSRHSTQVRQPLDEMLGQNQTDVRMILIGVALLALFFGYILGKLF